MGSFSLPGSSCPAASPPTTLRPAPGYLRAQQSCPAALVVFACRRVCSRRAKKEGQYGPGSASRPATFQERASKLRRLHVLGRQSDPPSARPAACVRRRRDAVRRRPGPLWLLPPSCELAPYQLFPESPGSWRSSSSVSASCRAPRCHHHREMPLSAAGDVSGSCFQSVSRLTLLTDFQLLKKGDVTLG
jgi:hypothetical protein